MSIDNEITEQYLNMKRAEFHHIVPITEAIGNEQRLIRFVLPATIDLTINQNDVEEIYTYDHYVNDIQKHITTEQILIKLNNIVEELVITKVREMNNNVNGELTLDSIPTIKNAQMYRFTFESLIDKYEELYNEEQVESPIKKP